MNHPELIAAPLLMLADYLLTILGAKMSLQVYRKHFVLPSYELNPVWRKSVDRIRWFNPRHLAGVVLITGVLVLLDQVELTPADGAEGPPFDYFELLLGILLGAFSAVCGRHLSNLLQFRYLNRHPEEVSGEVRLSMKFVMKISQYIVVGWLPLVALIVWLAPSAYTVGILLGLLNLLFAHFVWGWRAKSLPSPSGSSKAP